MLEKRDRRVRLYPIEPRPRDHLGHIRPAVAVEHARRGIREMIEDTPNGIER